MTFWTTLLALVLEFFRLIRGAGGVGPALAEIQKVNETMVEVKKAKTAEEAQSAAERVSRTLSGE